MVGHPILGDPKYERPHTPALRTSPAHARGAVDSLLFAPAKWPSGGVKTEMSLPAASMADDPWWERHWQRQTADGGAIDVVGRIGAGGCRDNSKDSRPCGSAIVALQRFGRQPQHALDGQGEASSLS